MRGSLRWKAICLVACCAFTAAACQTAAVAGDPAPAAIAPPVSAETESRIFERQQIMTQLDDDTKELGEIVSGELPKGKLAATTRSIAKGAQDALAAFKEPLPGGRSKPEVWSNHADFMQRMDVFVRETEAMAKLGEAGNLGGVTEKLITALPCKECHDLYREPKKPGQTPAAPKS